MRTAIRSCAAALAILSVAGTARAAKLKSIGVSVSDLGNPFFVRIGEAVEAKAKELGGAGVKVTIVSSAYDLQRQIGQVDGFIEKKVDLIILTAADPIGIEPAVRRAQKAGIRVLAVDVNAKGADATVTTDNTQAGEIACAYLAKLLNGKGNVVIINGPPVSAVADRVKGCRRALAQHPDLVLLSDVQNGGGNRDGGLEKMTDLLTAFPRIDGVFAINDPTAMGAELAARQAHRGFVITGVDGAPSIEERLKDGASLIEGSSAQFPDEMAGRAVEIGVALLNGRRPVKDTILIPAVLVTKGNVKRYRGWE